MKIRMMPRVRTLLASSQELAKATGVPVEAILIHLAQLMSSLVGHLIHIPRTDGNPLHARFSLLLMSPDARLPEWAAREWRYLERSQNEFQTMNKLFFEDPHKIAHARRQIRRQKQLGFGSEFEVAALEYALERAKNHQPFAPLKRVEKGGGKSSASPRFGSLLAEDWLEIRKVIRSRTSDSGYWASLDLVATGHQTLLGWMQSSNWSALIKETSAIDTRRLGWVLEIPREEDPSDSLTHVRPLADLMLKDFQWEPTRTFSYVFQPTASIQDTLNWHWSWCQSQTNRVFIHDQSRVIPDEWTGWKLAALFAAICQGGEGSDLAKTREQGMSLGIVLSLWLVNQHAYRIRYAFPSDEKGRFTGPRKNIFRALKNGPIGIRAIQRRLKGVNQSECLMHLQAMIDAGLASERGEGKYALREEAAPKYGLSDFLSEFED